MHENMTAYFVCQLMNVSGKALKHSITPKRLLEPLRKPVKKQNKADDEAYLKEQFKHVYGGDNANGDHS